MSGLWRRVPRHELNSPVVREPAIDWRVALKRRMVVAVAFLALWGAAIETRLIHLQVVRHADLMARAARQQMRTVQAPAKRGDILDRRGKVLVRASMPTPSTPCLPRSTIPTA